MTASKRRKDTWLLGIAATLLAIGFWLGQPDTRTAVGREVPAFSIPLIANGQGTADLRSGSANAEITVVEFFASWCSTCRRNLPALEKTEAAERIRWLSVSVDDAPGPAVSASKQWGLQRPVAWDETGELLRWFGISVLPSTVVIGVDGRVEEVMTGSVSAERLTTALNRVEARGPR